MSSNNSNSEIRELSLDEANAAAGGAIHLHIPGLFHLAIGDHEVSIGVLGHGVGFNDSEGGFTFEFDN
jgi:hypothetical protein